MCLVVDAAAMTSMETDQPWVYAVDLYFDHTIKASSGEYPGYFRVAIDSILPELYPMLIMAKTPQQLWPADNRVWVSAFD